MRSTTVTVEPNRLNIPSNHTRPRVYFSLEEHAQPADINPSRHVTLDSDISQSFPSKLSRPLQRQREREREREREISMEASVAVVAEELKAMEIANDKKPVVVGDDGGEAKNAATADIAAAAAESQKKTKKMKNTKRIHVSNSKRPFLFYCNLAKRYIKQYNSVELSALGMAIPTVITIAETLKRNGLAVEKKISTCTVVSKLVDVENGRIVVKAQIAILLEKADKIEETAVAAA